MSWLLKYDLVKDTIEDGEIISTEHVGQVWIEAGADESISKSWVAAQHGADRAIPVSSSDPDARGFFGLHPQDGLQVYRRES